MIIESIQQFLTDLNLTENHLLFIGAMALISLFFSMRALVKWYLGVDQLRAELQSIRADLKAIKESIEQDNALKNDQMLTVKPKTDEKPPATFQLNH